LLARDLKLIKPQDYEELVQRAIELKRMLTALIQKLKADRYKLFRNLPCCSGVCRIG
jgi:hypothetical protein